MLECPFVDSFLRRPLDSSTTRIGVPDHIPAWHICLESLGMPCPALHALAPLTPPGVGMTNSYKYTVKRAQRIECNNRGAGAIDIAQRVEKVRVQ